MEGLAAVEDPGDFDAYNFPEDEVTQRHLYWMGADYISYVGSSVYKGFRLEDPGCQLIAVKCEEPPEIKTYYLPGSETLASMEAIFKLQVAIRASSGKAYRIYTTLYYDVQDLFLPGDAIIRFHLQTDKSVPI